MSNAAKKQAKMSKSKTKKYDVFYITKLSKYVGTFEAESEAAAEEMALEGELYQGIGGACHQCTDKLGDAEDGEFVVSDAV